MRIFAAVLLWSLAYGVPAYAQTPNPTPSPDPEGKHSGAPLGQFTAGPFVVTPTFRIGTLALDTNVGYTRDRTPDFVASGGPGLDVALPFGDHWKLDLRGTSEYFYFHRTSDLRRWTGAGTVALLWATTGTRASISTRVSKDFSRPSFEVDTRIASNQRFAGGDIERDLGRLTLRADAYYAASRLESDQEFRGADLTAALTVDMYQGGGEFRYRLTPITSLLLEGAYREMRFPNASPRNYSEQNVGLGLRTNGLFDARVTAGVRRSQLLVGDVVKTQPYFRGNITQGLGRRFRVTARYRHESSISAFASDGDLPTFERRSVDLELSIGITRRIDMRIGGSRDRTISDGLVTVILDDETTLSGKRDDVAYVGRADIGMRLGQSRTSLFASYTIRDSPFFSDLGIKGFQMGARVEYSPQQ